MEHLHEYLITLMINYNCLIRLVLIIHFVSKVSPHTRHVGRWECWSPSIVLHKEVCIRMIHNIIIAFIPGEHWVLIISLKLKRGEICGKIRYFSSA